MIDLYASLSVIAGKCVCSTDLISKFGVIDWFFEILGDGFLQDSNVEVSIDLPG